MTDERISGPRDAGHMLAESAAAIAHASDLDSALARLMALAIEATGATFGAFLLQDPDLATLQLATSRGLDEPAHALLSAGLSDEHGPAGAAVRDRRPLTLSGDEGATGELLRSIGATSLALRPLIVERDSIEAGLGVLVLGWSGLTPAPGGETAARAFADLAAVAVDRAKLASLAAERSEWFERMAHTDPLTGLANHRTFARVLELELARASRQGGEVSVAVFDVDCLHGDERCRGPRGG